MPAGFGATLNINLPDQKSSVQYDTSENTLVEDIFRKSLTIMVTSNGEDVEGASNKFVITSPYRYHTTVNGLGTEYTMLAVARAIKTPTVSTEIYNNSFLDDLNPYTRPYIGDAGSSFDIHPRYRSKQKFSLNKKDDAISNFYYDSYADVIDDLLHMIPIEGILTIPYSSARHLPPALADYARSSMKGNIHNYVLSYDVGAF